jgi:transcriptional regulator with XRE-family HTH domain
LIVKNTKGIAMNLQSEKTLRFAKKALESHIVALAADKGIKITKARAQIAADIDVDPSSIRQFLNGEVVKPAPKTMQKYVDWLGVNPEKVEKPMPTPKEIYDLEQKIRDLEASVESWKRCHEATRKNLQKYSEQVAQLEPADPDHADKYQVVHRENSYWMQNSEAYIKLFTHYDDISEDGKMRLCTIPIPLLINQLQGKEGESSEDWKARHDEEEQRRKLMIMKVADEISNIYSECGFPEAYVGVDVQFSSLHNG